MAEHSMPDADPAPQDDIDRDDADHGAPVEQQTPGDTATARQPKQTDQASEGRDDSDAAKDPLILAQMEPEKPADAPAPTTTTTKSKPPAAPKREQPTPPKQEPKAAGEPPKAEEPPKANAEDEDEREATSDLPAEDWQKLTHKGKSQFLAQRRIVREAGVRAKQAEAKAKQASEQYQTVERFVREQGLSDEEYAEAVAIGGLVKRADPRAIELLEERLKAIRQARGIAAPQPAAPAAPAAPVLDEDLAALLKEAEELGLERAATVRAKYQKPAAAPAQPPAATPPVQPPVAPAAPVQPYSAPQGFDEHVATIDALVALGVPEDKVVAHVSALLSADPELRKTQPGSRMKAIISAHHKASASSAPPAARQPTQQPLSGRGRPAAAGGRTSTTNADPLKHAIMPRAGR
jgi:hypothetical protein